MPVIYLPGDYDAWKLRSPYDDEPEEECFHEEREINWEGRAECQRCGETWWASKAEIEADRAHEAAFDKAMRREERLEKWRQVRGWFRSLIPSRKKQQCATLDDEIPF